MNKVSFLLAIIAAMVATNISAEIITLVTKHAN